MTDKGGMMPSWDVWCACGDWVNVGHGKAPERAAIAEKLGWRKLPRRSWTCPICMKRSERPTGERP